MMLIPEKLRYVYYKNEILKRKEFIFFHKVVYKPIVTLTETVSC